VPDTLDRLNATASRWSPRQLARRALVSCVPRRRLLGSLPGADAVYLTFDDGPHPEYTPRVLDVLAEHRAHATFFVVGQRCVQYPDLLRRISNEGHAIGNHTYSHVKARDVSLSNYMGEILQTNDVIQSLVGKRCSLFRPPHGSLGLRTLFHLWRAEQTIVLWSVDPKDYCSDELQIKAWFAAHSISRGDVVLMHDTQPHASAVTADLLHACRQLGASAECLAQFAE
jgi:peptidoglycan/xylan/chitin deacetylase (PgdA/CDA1 family)